MARAKGDFENAPVRIVGEARDFRIHHGLPWSCDGVDAMLAILQLLITATTDGHPGSKDLGQNIPDICSVYQVATAKPSNTNLLGRSGLASKFSGAGSDTGTKNLTMSDIFIYKSDIEVLQ